jgi:hypothetical protein
MAGFWSNSAMSEWLVNGKRPPTKAESINPSKNMGSWQQRNNNMFLNL